jgi:hypothetical protein
VWLNVANASPVAGDALFLQCSIEGYRTSRLAWGGANAQPLSVGFWFYTSTAGTYSMSIRNFNGTRSYVATFVCAASTWEWKTFTIPGDTTGAWATDITAGLSVSITAMTSATFLTPTANAWVSGNFIGVTGTINATAVSSKFAATGLIVLPGIELPSAARAPFIMRPFDQELVLCQRYYEKTYPYADRPGSAYGVNNTGGEYNVSVPIASNFPFMNVRYVTKRAAPTLVPYSPWTGTPNTMRYVNSNADVPAMTQEVGTTGGVVVVNNTAIAASATLQFHAVADARF